MAGRAVSLTVSCISHIIHWSFATVVFAEIPMDVACEFISSRGPSLSHPPSTTECESIRHGVCSIISSHDHGLKVSIHICGW